MSVIDHDRGSSGPAVQELPTSMRAIVPVSTARWIASLRAGRPIALEDGGRGAVLEALDRVDEAIGDCVHGSDPVEVLTIIEMIAATVQVEVPQQAGLGVYVALLQPLPPHVLKLAALEVLAKHTFRTMPLPAELLATEIVGEWKAVVIWWGKMLPHWKKAIAAPS
jgi:hypothetical protein